MPKNGRPKKKYVPRVFLPDPIARLQPASKKKKDILMTVLYTALQEITAGRHPGEVEWSHLADAVNTLEVLIEQKKLSASASSIIEEANTAMLAAAKRHKSHGAVRFDAPGLRGVRDVVALYEQCIVELNEQEMYEAKLEVERRIRLHREKL